MSKKVVELMDGRGVPTKSFRVRSVATFQLGPKDVEHPRGRSLTIPDDSYTIQELLDRHLAGIGPDVMKNPLFDGDDSDDLHDYEDLSKFADLDFADQDEVLRSARLVQDAYRTHLEQRKLKAEAAAADAERATKEAAKAKADALAAGASRNTTPS